MILSIQDLACFRDPYRTLSRRLYFSTYALGYRFWCNPYICLSDHQPFLYAYKIQLGAFQPRI